MKSKDNRSCIWEKTMKLKTEIKITIRVLKHSIIKWEIFRIIWRLWSWKLINKSTPEESRISIRIGSLTMKIKIEVQRDQRRWDLLTKILSLDLKVPRMVHMLILGWTTNKQGRVAHGILHLKIPLKAGTIQVTIRNTQAEGDQIPPEQIGEGPHITVSLKLILAKEESQIWMSL